MSLPEEDLAARGRSIFERLRQEHEPEAAEVEPGEEPGIDEAPSTEAQAEAPAEDAVLAAPPVMEVVTDSGLVIVDDPVAGAVHDPADADETRSAEDPRDFGAPIDAPPAGGAWTDAAPEDRGTAGVDTTAEEATAEGSPSSADTPATGGAWTAAEQVVAEERTAPELPPPAESTPAAAEVALTGAPVIEAPLVADPPPVPVAAPEDLDGIGATETDEPAVPALAAPPDLDPQRFVRPLPRVLAIANQKGGVGKTTTTVNLGASLAVLGYRVLVIDLDPQGNATTGLGINSRNLETSIYDVILHDVPLDDCVEATQLRNLFVAPATIDLAGAEIELVPAFSRELRLRRALEEVRSDYDFVLIDCPPSLGLLTVNALSAATEVAVPIQCEYYALEGLGQLLRNVNLVQSNLNPKLELSAIVLTMYDGRTKLAEQVADEVRQHFGDKVCRNVVPRTVRLSEAPSFGQPIIVFDPSSRGALAYRELAMEVSGGPPQRTG